MAIRKLRNLLMATEAVRYGQRVRVRLARFGRQHVFATLDRDLVFFPQTERSCHALAPGIERFRLDARLFEPLHLRVHAQGRRLMAVNGCRDAAEGAAPLGCSWDK